MENLIGSLKVMFVVSIAMMIAGCSTFGDKNKQTTMPSLLEPQSIVKFTDVPVIRWDFNYLHRIHIRLRQRECVSECSNTEEKPRLNSWKVSTRANADV